MTSTRWTAGCLTVAAVLGLLAAGVFLVDDHQRGRIVDQGHQVRAVVTADHEDEFDHWYTVDYPVQGTTRSADLRYPWVIDTFPVGSELTVYVDADRPERIATADGYSTPVWASAPGFLAVLAVAAAFASTAGFVSNRRSS
ncbi:hypothetical protein ACWT_4821 [Actinoplanes sp. SE50]|uniref:DUF3592 domain-containing protein n=1 Tax=unclassified Actinoplanes TaxID=2626549 RepID=UPI00023EC308|nr:MULTISPECIES: DUF3592 domain-containing protein [unclassified Actinoplanes]AEV85840.1 hypothetical protein ACPL_4951 [Actinoplanes sp. SE50/110]ATO84236.1 hypothetical protein ACWT_4821 [Actinoplanes sp. SE50]SLM01646.1 hypothetical protein ACSP50_4882 [Actinoplanes sp. SE50/110]